LLDIGTDKEKLCNVILVRGYVDLETDFVRIIDNWVDTTITENKLWTIYDCVDDFLLKYKNIIKRFYSNPALNVVFEQACPYKKCTYCNHQYLPDVNFVKDVDSVVRNIHTLTSAYKTDTISIADSYCNFNKIQKQILEEVNCYKITIYSGIMALQSIKHIEYINKYIFQILVGMESTIDSTLSFIKKGYTYDHIMKAVDNIIKYMDKDTWIIFNAIIDLPTLSIQDSILNLNRMKEIWKRFRFEGFNNFHFNPHGLCIDPGTSLMDNNLLRKTKNPTCGENYFLDKIDNYPFLPDYMNTSFSRFDLNGIQLPSDFELMDISFLLD